ncbi:MAG: 3'-5' exonuclease [Treponema sp.]|jgi:DNA polymerase-3 subunit epsilon|nr:3'-5' exonuclease [Treponema sp.]
MKIEKNRSLLRNRRKSKGVIFFDVETNGLSGDSSVLSMGAIKTWFDGTDIGAVEETFSRFYYRNPGEPENAGAIRVNGLTDEVIRRNRGDALYPEQFKYDRDFPIFCSGVRHFVGHNIAFDQKFLAFSLPHTFCTMRENTNIIKLIRWAGGYKFPRLKEAADYYQIEIDEHQLHGSDYDAFLTYEIFKRMLGNNQTKKRAVEFLEKP